MATQRQLQSLIDLLPEARASEHIWPEMAVCEAMFESAWMTSELSRDYRNLFGQKCALIDGVYTPPSGVLKVTLPTREFLDGKYVKVRACFLWFLSYQDAFTHRMALLIGAAAKYPAYARALHAATAEEYIVEVSRAWSTYPLRAEKVLEIYHAHSDVLEVA